MARKDKRGQIAAETAILDVLEEFPGPLSMRVLVTRCDQKKRHAWEWSSVDFLKALKDLKQIVFIVQEGDGWRLATDQESAAYTLKQLERGKP